MTNEVTAPLPTRRVLLTAIERLDTPADVKALLARLAEVTARVGTAIVQVGRRILAFVLDAIRLFPHITLAVIVCHAIGQLIASVAILGAVLGPLLAPLLLAFGIGAGAIMDVANCKFRQRVDALVGSFGTFVGD